MPNPKLQSLLENSAVVVSAGSRAPRERSIFKHLAASVLLVAVGTVATVGSVQAQNYNAPSQIGYQSEEGVRAIHGQVQSVRKLNDRQQRGSHRGRISLGTIAGAVVGGTLGSQIGSGDGRKLATAVGALAGGSMANRLADRRYQQDQALPGYDNARRVQDDVVVVVAVRNGNTFESYEIVQPAAINLRRGDDVVLSTSPDGRNLVALPVVVEEEYNDRPRNRRNWR